MGLTLGVGTLALSSLLPGMAATMISRTQSSITGLDPHATNAQMVGQMGSVFSTTLILILPLACLVLVAGVAGNLVSGGLVFSFRAVRFDISRINPIAGMKRLFDKQALVRLSLASAKLAILAFISWLVVGSRVPAIVATQGQSASAIAATCLDAIFQLGLTITVLLAVVALIDFVVQRRRAQQSIRMTKEEVKQEYKESEGDPMMRSARKRRARQMAFARMMDAVPTSDVIVTNPTTLAVALKYDSLTMKAPKIVAKGQRLMAERIKQIARENNVPIVEDKPLARALFPRPIGAEVPAHLYRAVAKLLVLVHQARFATAARNGRRGSEAWPAQDARGAAAGVATRPWWAGSAGGAVLDCDASGYGEADVSDAARLYASAPATAAESAWLDTSDEATGAAAPEAAGTSDVALAVVDEEALAVAMAEDELGNVTPDELALLEAGMVIPSDAVDDEEPEL
jgi:flagellar biosynthetic protein FlhB